MGDVEDEAGYGQDHAERRQGHHGPEQERVHFSQSLPHEGLVARRLPTDPRLLKPGLPIDAIGVGVVVAHDFVHAVLHLLNLRLCDAVALGGEWHTTLIGTIKNAHRSPVNDYCD